MKRKVTLMNVKGSYDYDPNEQRLRNYIQDTLKKIFEEFGYKPLETPILCYYDLLAGKYDESNDLLNEIYKLSDQGERDLGLRYDLTVPFAKYITMKKDLRLPFKRYEIGKVFRDGPVKIGRDREFLQCDVDVVGLEGQLVEAELLSLWQKGYKALDIDIYIKYNSRNLMRGLIKELGITDEDSITKVVTIIDKMDKITETELILELTKVGMDETKCKTLLEYFSLSLEEMKEKFSDTKNEELSLGLKETSELKNYLKDLGMNDICIFTPSLARGQDYYTGNVFEVFAKNGELTCSLGAGGRYDKLITNFIDDDNTYPAVGVSFGLSTIYEILKDREEFKNASFIDILIIPMETESKALCLANNLRALNYKVELDMTGKKLKKSFEYADREGIPYTIVLGENEIENGKVSVKNMTTGTETELSLEHLEELKNIIK